MERYEKVTRQEDHTYMRVAEGCGDSSGQKAEMRGYSTRLSNGSLETGRKGDHSDSGRASNAWVRIGKVLDVSITEPDARWTHLRPPYVAQARVGSSHEYWHPGI